MSYSYRLIVGRKRWQAAAFSALVKRTNEPDTFYLFSQSSA